MWWLLSGIQECVFSRGNGQVDLLVMIIDDPRLYVI